MSEVERDSKRLLIAISLIQGKLVEKPKDGYDLCGFYPAAVRSIVSSALDLAEELIVQNEKYCEK